MENSITCRGSRRCHFRHKLNPPELKIDDGAVTVFLYVDGKPDGISKDLVELVRFVGNTSAGNACSPKLEELLGYIDDLKQNPEVKEAYMTFEEYVESERREERYEILMEIEKIKAERDAAVNERNAMKEELDAKDEALNAKDKEINAVIRERDAIREEINAIEEEINAIEKQRNAIEKRRSAIEERRSAIEEFNVALQRIKELEKILKNNGTRSSTDTYGRLFQSLCKLKNTDIRRMNRYTVSRAFCPI